MPSSARPAPWPAPGWPGASRAGGTGRDRWAEPAGPVLQQDLNLRTVREEQATHWFPTASPSVPVGTNGRMRPHRRGAMVGCCPGRSPRCEGPWPGWPRATQLPHSRRRSVVTAKYSHRPDHAQRPTGAVPARRDRDVLLGDTRPTLPQRLTCQDDDTSPRALLRHRTQMHRAWTAPTGSASEFGRRGSGTSATPSTTSSSPRLSPPSLAVSLRVAEVVESS